jgi:predicted dehydrogenase
MTWICDVDSNRVKKALDQANDIYAKRDGVTTYTGIKTTDDFRNVLADPDLDVVWVCTPDHWHALCVTHAARAGKHIYTEKPLARTIEEGRAMVQAVERSGVVAQVGSQQRSDSGFQRAISLARNGTLGKIQSIQVGLPGGAGGSAPWTQQEVPPELNYDMWLGPAPYVPYVSQRVHYEWRWNYDYAGGQVADWINHHYDIAQFAAGVNGQAPIAIRKSWAEMGTNPLFNTANKYFFEAHYTGGEVIQVSSTFRGGVRIEGDKGWVIVDRGGMEYSSPSLQNLVLPSDGFVMPGGKVDHRSNFIESILSRTTPRSPVRDSYYIAMVAHLANASFRANISELLWDPVAEKVTNSTEAQRFLAANYRGPWSLPV